MYAISNSRISPQERSAIQRLAPQPRTVLETGLPENLLGDLVCKHLHDAGVLDMSRLVERLALTGAVLEEILTFLRKDGRVEVLGQAGNQALRYGLTERGRSAARDALARSGYIGAAPFPALCLPGPGRIGRCVAGRSGAVTVGRLASRCFHAIGAAG